MSLRLKNYIVFLMLIIPSAFAEKCNDRTDVVQDPSWYRLRINEVEKAKAAFVTLGKAGDGDVEKSKVNSALGDAKKFLSSALWQYPQIDDHLNQLAQGLNICQTMDGKSVTMSCYSQSYLKQNSDFLERLTKDMQDKLGTLKACDPVYLAQQKYTIVKAKRLQKRRNDKAISAINTQLGVCQRAAVIPTAATLELSTLLQSKPLDQINNPERNPADEEKPVHERDKDK